MLGKKKIYIIWSGIVLVALLGLFLIGQRLEQLSRSMNDEFIEKVFANRSREVIQEFKKTEKLLNDAVALLECKVSDEQLVTLLGMLGKVDRKITSVWYYPLLDHCCYVQEYEGVLRQIEKTEFSLHKSLYLSKEGLHSGIHCYDGNDCWRIVHYKKVNGRDFILGFDIDLRQLHDFFAEFAAISESYVFIVNQQGKVISHPEEAFVGKLLSDKMERKELEDVIQRNQPLETVHFSRFLSLPVIRKYYPLRLSDENWIIAVNIPTMVNTERIERFHRYALMISLLFVFVLFLGGWYARYHWLKERKLRQKIEKESALLAIQQLKNQMNPHFLFNSLNSLHALIGVNDSLAKEFVVKLSKVYRYLLEKNKESFSTVTDELYIVEQYYFLQKIRFGDALNLRIEPLTDVVRRNYLPTLSLQLLVENAIKHNLSTQLHPLCINIYSDANNLIVVNNYQPRAESNTDSIGMGYVGIEQIYNTVGGAVFEFGVIEGHYVCKLPLLKRTSFD